MFESLYGSPWHHPYFFWAFGGPLLGLFAWRALTSEAPRARALAALLAAFQLGILADAWLNAPKLSPLSGGTAEAVAIAFVILGDARFFLLLERFGRGQTRLRASVYALGWSLLVPVGSLLAKSFSSNGRVHYLTYELAFAALVIGLRTQLIPRLPPGPGRTFALRLCGYELTQYLLWATADVCILAGREEGYLLRLVPNALYYVGFVPFAWWAAPKELKT